jgi:hypothetical protein
MIEQSKLLTFVPSTVPDIYRLVVKRRRAVIVEDTLQIFT